MSTLGQPLRRPAIATFGDGCSLGNSFAEPGWSCFPCVQLGGPEPGLLGDERRKRKSMIRAEGGLVNPYRSSLLEDHFAVLSGDPEPRRDRTRSLPHIRQVNAHVMNQCRGRRESMSRTRDEGRRTKDEGEDRADVQGPKDEGLGRICDPSVWRCGGFFSARPAELPESLDFGPNRGRHSSCSACARAKRNSAVADRLSGTRYDFSCG